MAKKPKKQESWLDQVGNVAGDVWDATWTPLGEVGGYKLPSTGNLIMGGLTGAPYVLAEALYNNVVQPNLMGPGKLLPSPDVLTRDIEGPQKTTKPKVAQVAEPERVRGTGKVDPRLAAVADTMARMQMQSGIQQAPQNLLMGGAEQVLAEDQAGMQNYAAMLGALADYRHRSEQAAMQQAQKSAMQQQLLQAEVDRANQNRWRQLLAGGLKSLEGPAFTLLQNVNQGPGPNAYHLPKGLGDWNQPTEMVV